MKAFICSSLKHRRSSSLDSFLFIMPSTLAIKAFDDASRLSSFLELVFPRGRAFSSSPTSSTACFPPRDLRAAYCALNFSSSLMTR